MKVTSKNANLLRMALQEWAHAGLLTDKMSQTLLSTIEVVPFNWRILARLAFIVSLICFIIAIGAIFMDEALMKLLALYFNAPAFVKALTFAGIAFLFYRWGYVRKKKHPETFYRNEAIFFLAVLATAGSTFYIGDAVQVSKQNFSWLLLLEAIAYGCIGYLVRSTLIWFFSLLSLGGWLGAATGYISGWDAYYFSMTYPLRFVLFGTVLVALTSLIKRNPRFATFYQTTLVMGLLYLFMALWILSIFGYHDFLQYSRVAPSHGELFAWSLLFGLVAIGAIYHGLKYDNTTTRGFGIVFLLINLYTKYFEYFWSSIHKAIFFIILGLSLWIVGAYAEKIWKFNIDKEK